MKRVGIIGCFQESNTFSPRILGVNDYVHVEGAEILEKYETANNELGGILDACLKHPDWKIIPGHWFFGVSAGPVEAETWRYFLQTLLNFVREEPCDAWFVVLHGAMCANDCDDLDGEILKKLRGEVGEGIPIIATVDPHAFLTDEMCRNATGIIPYQLFPHVDIQHAGKQAVRFLEGIWEQGWAPSFLRRSIPMIVPAELHWTDSVPMVGWVDYCESAPSRHEDLFQLSFQYIQPWMNLPGAGWSILALAKRSDQSTQEALGREIDVLEDRILNERIRFKLELAEVKDLARYLAAAERYPVIINQTSDALAAGATGDNTTVLLEMQKVPANYKLAGWVIDSVAAESCHRLGEGKVFKGTVGGRLDKEFCSPLDLEAEVLRVDDGSFTTEGDYMKGVRFECGPSAVVRCRNLDLIICSKAAMNADVGFYRARGIHPENYHGILVKSASTFRSGFKEFADTNIYFNTPGFSSANLRSMPFRKELLDTIYP